jgi:hypothetical protein
LCPIDVIARGLEHEQLLGNGLSNQPIDTLFFAAGPDDEEHGLYGRLDVNE